jgi:isopentenyl diphosphate isomerase/L-lactate dehydrogenase-like FMN-dependent dehydrogenase
MEWSYIQWLREITRMKLVIKGIQHPADARKCVEVGVDAIIVSNHGGRSEESGFSTIESLPAVIEAVQGRIPVLIDGGLRRGSDILKALALGANAICIGRPYLWGLGAFGQEGVERTLQILRAELHVAMQQCGVTSLKDLDTSYLAP